MSTGSPRRGISQSRADGNTSRSKDGGRSASKEDNQNDSQYKSKLLNSKAAAKDIEREALTLRNRIALLEKEEEKVLQKIEGTKKQAMDILQKKNRNHKLHEDKERAIQDKHRDIEVKKTQINNKKDEQKDKIVQANTEKIICSKEKANEIKESMKVI